MFFVNRCRRKCVNNAKPVRNRHDFFRRTSSNFTFLLKSVLAHFHTAWAPKMPGTTSIRTCQQTCRSSDLPKFVELLQLQTINYSTVNVEILWNVRNALKSVKTAFLKSIFFSIFLFKLVYEFSIFELQASIGPFALFLW